MNITPDVNITQDVIINSARAWLGTPYHHQASIKHVGTDCLGLIRGVYRDLYGHEPEDLPAYSPDWAEARGEETMIDGAGRHLEALAKEQMQPGDVLVFRFKAGVVAKHAAIYSYHHKMIHAFEGAAVCEVHLSDWWLRRIAAVFRFPQII